MSLRHWKTLRRALEILITANLLIPLLFVTARVGIGAEGDALDYRLPLIQWALAHWSYPCFHWTYVDDYPALGELLMAMFRPFADWGPRIVSVAAYLLFVLGSWRLGRLLLPRIWALLGTLLVCTAHLLIMQDNLLMVDNLASAFTLWSSVFLIEEWNTKLDDPNNYLKAGISAGLALATRYTQLPPVAVLGIFALICAVRTGRRPVRSLLLFGLPAILLVSPWLIRNWVANGNPLFPLAVPLLGGKDLDPARYREVIAVLTHYGFGTSLKELLLLFYRFAFFKDAFDYSVGPLPLALLPWVILYCILTWRKKSAALAPVVLYLAFVIAWFYSSQQGRFLVHALPFGVFSALLGMRAWTLHFRLRNFRNAILGVLVVLGFLGTIKHVTKHRHELPGLSVAIHEPDVPQWLNAHLLGGKVLLLERTSNLFAVRGDFVFAYPHPYATSLYDYRDYPDVRLYYADLYKEGVRFIYVTDRSVIKQLPPLPGEPAALEPAYFGKQGGVVFALRQI